MVNLQCCVSGIQQSDLVTYFLFQTLFHYSLLKDTECSSLDCTIGTCLFYIEYCVSANPKLQIYPSPLFPL